MATDAQRFVRLSLPATFTVLEAMTFRDACQTALAEHPNLETLDLDFQATTFIDSTGIGALVICRRLCQARQVDLRLCGVGPQVQMALALTELDQVFTIVPAENPNPAPDHSVPATLAQPQGGSPEPASVISSGPRFPAVAPPLTHPSVKSRAKRAMDIVGAIVGLGITAVLAVPIAIAIKTHDGGPVFFAQTRCSWMGRRFRIWKFRTMVTNAEALKHQVANQVEGPLFKNDRDPRVTPVGRFLRKTSLDELPQFWNVLRGDMSLVGTRPPTPGEIERYDVPAWQRLNVKPGMTGEWQVSGRSNIRSFEEVIRLDLRYQENWSLWYDIKLILKTILLLFTNRSGAS